MSGWVELDIEALDAAALELHRAEITTYIGACTHVDEIIRRMGQKPASEDSPHLQRCRDRIHQIDRRLFALEHDLTLPFSDEDETLFQIWRPR